MSPAYWVPKRQKPQKDTQPRLVGCPAYPTTGIIAGASREWCLQARGQMDKCNDCTWGK